MKKNFIQAVVFAAFCYLSNPSQAANMDGTISNVTPFGSLVFIFVSGSWDGAASSCFSSSSSMAYAFDPSTTQGKAILATVLSAKLSNKEVYIYGSGVCNTANPYNGAGSETIMGVDLKGQ